MRDAFLEYDYITPTLSRYWDLGRGELHAKSKQDICIAPHPYKHDIFTLHISLCESNGENIDQKTCDISATRADQIENEMTRIRSTRIRFIREDSTLLIAQ